MNSFSDLFLLVAVGEVFIAGVLAIVALCVFKSIYAKLVVVEVLTNLMLAVIALWALYTRQPLFIDVCIALALIMFLGVVAYYQYLSLKETGHVDILR